MGKTEDNKKVSFGMEDNMTNFDQYLKTDFKFAMESLSYKQLPPAPANTQMALTCRDLLEAKTELDKLMLRFTRSMKFEPESLYELSVTYTAVANINVQGLSAVDWDNIDLSAEIRNGHCTLLSNLVSRTSMMIAQITSANGQVPVITPPAIAKTNG